MRHLLSLAIALLLGSSANAAPAAQFQYSGLLLDSSNMPVTSGGPYSFHLAIWDGANCYLFGRDYTTITPDSAGHFILDVSDSTSANMINVGSMNNSLASSMQSGSSPNCFTAAGNASASAVGANRILQVKIWNSATTLWEDVDSQPIIPVHEALAAQSMTGAIPNGASTANMLYATNNSGTGNEFKSVQAGSGIAVTNGVGQITVAANLTASDIPSLNASKITAGTLAATLIPGLPASQITSGTLAASQIPDLDAAKIISGIFATARIPNLDASKVTSGTFAVAQLPGLDASQITSGIFPTTRIPSLDASKITSGVLSTAVGGTGLVPTVANANRVYGLNSAGTDSEFKTIVGGSGITVTPSSGTITISSAGGSVTNVGMTGNAMFSISPSSISTFGTFNLDWQAVGSAGQVLASPAGAAGAPAFRSLVATDIPSLGASKITSGVLTPAVGGTGLTPAAADANKFYAVNAAGTGTEFKSILPGSGINVDTSVAGQVTISSSLAGGTVTSVSMTGNPVFQISGSPITGNGTFNIDWANVATGNLVWASPNGASGPPAFRALDAADIASGTFTAARIPNLDAAKITTGTLAAAVGGTGLVPQAANSNQVYGVNAAGTNTEFKTLVQGTGVSITNSAGQITIAATGSGGTVTNVGLAMPGIFNVAASPVTGAGTFNVTLANATANTVFAGPSSGGPAAPGFRTLVVTDLPSIPVTQLTGILPTANGGTGLDGSSAGNGKLLIGNGSGYTLATLQISNGISQTLGAGSITLSSNGTNSNTGSTLVERDPSGNFSAGAVDMATVGIRGNTTGTVTMTAPASFTDYSLQWPASVGGPGQVLTTDGTSALSWTTPSTGVTSMPDGSGAAPGWAFTNKTNTGIYRPGGATLAISTNGTEALRVNSAGYVGIGTKVPAGNLDVTTSSTSNTPFVINTPAGFAGNYVQYVQGGTVKYQVNSQGQTQGTPGSPGAPGYTFLNHTDLGMFYAGTGSLGFSTGGVERLRIDASGNVGIGTQNPAANLDVNGIIRATQICDNSGGNCKTISSGWGAGGSVTNVGLGGSSMFNITNSPVTTAGTINIDFANVATGNQVLASPDGASGPPAFRNLSTNDITSGTFATSLLGILPTTKLSGTLGTSQMGVIPTGNGGTGLATAPTSGQVLVGNSGSGYTLGTIAGANGIVPTSTSGLVTISTNGTFGNTANTLVMRDANGYAQFGSIGIAAGGNIINLVNTGAASYLLKLPASIGSPGQVLRTDGTNATSWVTPANATVAGADTQVQFNSSGTLGASPSFVWDNTNARLGIGSTIPPTKNLSFSGDAAQTVGMENRTTTGNGNTLTLQAGGAGAGSNRNGGDLILSSGVASGNGSAGISFQTVTSNQGTGTTARIPTTKMVVTGDGSVGIGTTSPQASLDVNGTARAKSLVIAAGTGIVGFNVDPASNYAMTLPNSIGSPAQVLSTDGVGTLSWVSPGTGTVTSVGLSMPGIFNVSSSPITGAGNISVTLNSASQNAVFAGPTSGSGTPVFRALDAADIATGTFATALLGTLPTTKLSGTLNTAQMGVIPTGNGGTGTSTAPTSGQILVGNSSSGYTLGTIAGANGIVPASTSGLVTISTNGTFASTGNTLVMRDASGYVQFGSIGIARGTGTVNIAVPTSTNYSMTLPNSIGSPGQVLSTNGTSALSWVTPGAGVTSMPDGTQASPGWAFTNKTNTGIFRPGGATLAIATNGTMALVIDSVGNVGVGAGSPSGDFQISRADKDTSLIVTNTSSSTNRYPAVVVQNFASSTSSGFPGLWLQSYRGSQSAPTAVQVNDTLGQITASGYNGSALQDGAFISFSAASNFSGGANPTNINFQTASATSPVTRMIITSGGSVGIGTAVPGALLDVAGAIRVQGDSLICNASTAGAIRYNGSGYVEVCAGSSPAWSPVSMAPASTSQNFVFAGPPSGSGTPSFRGLVAADLPNGIPMSKLTGTLGAANGGTGLDGSAAANGSLMIGTGSGYSLATLGIGGGLTQTLSSGHIALSTNAQTSAVNSTLVMRDGTGGFAASTATLGGVALNGGGGLVTLTAPAAATTYTFKVPGTAGSSGQVLATDGTGNLSWTSVPANGATFLAANGSASAPGFGFNSTTNTGMFLVSGGIGFSTSGAERMRLTTAGSLGIGQAAPTEVLDVTGNIRSSGQMYSKSNSGTSATVDFNTGNVQVTSNTGPTITLNNMKDGGSYVVIATNAASVTYDFANCNSKKWNPAPAASTASTTTIFNIINVGTPPSSNTCYISWSSGYQ